MRIGVHDIGVCSWSLRSQDTQDLIQKVQQLQLSHVQLGLARLLMLDDKRKHLELGQLRASGLILTAGMIDFPGENYESIASIRGTGGFVPDATWPIRRQLTLHAAALAAELKIPLLSTHVGFIPPSSNDRYKVLLDRILELAEPMQKLGVGLLMETGQESASELLQFLNDVSGRGVQVNFDPANMVLYGAGEAIEAVRILDRHIRHVHVKDAIASDQPGVKWGQEVPFGTGQIPPAGFLAALTAAGYTGPLVIERESGDQRLADVAAAIQSLRRAAGA